jgi:hypothetical protein
VSVEQSAANASEGTAVTAAADVAAAQAIRYRFI